MRALHFVEHQFSPTTFIFTETTFKTYFPKFKRKKLALQSAQYVSDKTTGTRIGDVILDIVAISTHREKMLKKERRS